MLTRLGAFIGRISDITSYRNIAVAVSIVSFGAVEFVVHHALSRFELPPFADSLIDAGFVGSSFGVAVWALLVGNCERRTRVRDDLERISDLNHEIRNALQVIAHSHYEADSEHCDMVMESVTRIDVVLKRLFPVVGGGGGAHGL
jgi:hypothetical protein